MRRLAIIHFNPIESYPPVLNWLNFLAVSLRPDSEVRVYTMRPSGSQLLFKPASSRIKIIRRGTIGGRRPVTRYVSYFSFYAGATLGLAAWRPDTILYYETLSAFPAILYKKVLHTSSRLFIHYHEYASVDEYRQGMQIAKWSHRMEKKIYSTAEWISHTNKDRLQYFKRDMEGVSLPALHVLPNYPPAAWGQGRQTRETQGEVLKIVYVGALSLDTMYTREFAAWVDQQAGAVLWDIYSNNITTEAMEFLEENTNGWIRLKPALNYFDLPEVLTGYQAGVILYKGHIPNYIYNAPNKLFEYLACGLDVWFPDKMKGSLPYITRGVYPKVISIDFDRLSAIDWSLLTDRTGLTVQPFRTSSEKELSVLLHQMES